MGATTKVHKFSGGRLVVGPSNLASPATNCGGTQLGTVQDLSLQATRRDDPIVAEEWGMSIYDLLLLDTEWILTARFVGWDEAAISRIFFEGAVGSGTPLMVDTQDSYGELAGDTKASDLLWLPIADTVEPAVRAYRALPFGNPKIYFSGRRPLIVTAQWICTRDSSGRTVRSDLLASGNL